MSAFLVLFMALEISHINTSVLGGSFSSFIISHQFFLLVFRFMLILALFFVWPIAVNSWSKKYDWSAEYMNEVKNRRYRYAVWFIVIDLAFQLL